MEEISFQYEYEQENLVNDNEMENLNENFNKEISKDLIVNEFEK